MSSITLIDEAQFKERLNSGIHQDSLDKYRITGDLQLTLAHELNALSSRQTEEYEFIMKTLNQISQDIAFLHLSLKKLRVEFNQMTECFRGSLESLSQEIASLHPEIKEIREEIHQMNEFSTDSVSALSQDVAKVRSEIQTVRDEVNRVKELPKPRAITLPPIRIESVRKIPTLK